MNINSKSCPYCAETIKLEAVKCRFCGANLDDSSESSTRSHGFFSQRSGSIFWSGAFLIILSFVNPTLEDFLEKQREEIAATNFKTEWKDLTTTERDLINAALKGAVVRNDYFLFSTYEVSFKSSNFFDDGGVKASTTLGVWRTFFVLPSWDSLSSKNETSKMIERMVDLKRLEGKRPSDLSSESSDFHRHVLSRLPKSKELDKAMEDFHVESPFKFRSKNTIVASKCKPGDCPSNNITFALSKNGQLVVVLRTENECALYTTKMFKDTQSLDNGDVMCPSFVFTKYIE